MLNNGKNNGNINEMINEVNKIGTEGKVHDELQKELEKAEQMFARLNLFGKSEQC